MGVARAPTELTEYSSRPPKEAKIDPIRPLQSSKAHVGDHYGDMRSLSGAFVMRAPTTPSILTP